MTNESQGGAPLGLASSAELGPVAEALRLAEKMMRDSWATGGDAAWQPGRAALESHLRAMLAAERGRRAAIAQEIDYGIHHGWPQETLARLAAMRTPNVRRNRATPEGCNDD